ncbi:MAG: glycoside hydrolase family 15 protein [Candidatus Magasanikbacteria bacterium]
MYEPIQNYGIISNKKTAALISKEGSLDWLPVSRIDSSSIFASILDDEKGGSWKIEPRKEHRSFQEYIENTRILVNEFETETGKAKVINFFAIDPTSNKNDEGNLALFRQIKGIEGEVEFKISFSPAPDYGRKGINVEKRMDGFKIVSENNTYYLQSSHEYEIKNKSLDQYLTIQKGERESFLFTAKEPSSVQYEVEDCTKALKETEKYWNEWVHECDLSICPLAGQWHELAVKSSLVLKSLFFEPSGAIVAAPTTSLPEEIGGKRNWDYRFSWIRDSSFTLQALINLGYTKEVMSYMDYLLDICRECTIDGEFKILYGVDESSNLEEKTLDHLEGYKNSRPVRIGNEAYNQDQWDIYGAVIDTVWKLSNSKDSYEMKNKTWKLINSLANNVVNIWNQPDEGIWETRGQKKHFTHSKVMCWVALDRALKLADKHNKKGEKERWKKEKRKIKEAVFQKGWNRKKESFTQSFNSENLDASLLLMPELGFIDGENPKMISTIKKIRKELGAGNGLIYRYKNEDGLPGKEGAFFLASFWLVDALCFADKKKEAEKIFKKLIDYSNHLNLYSEEIDPNNKNFLGNFPQGYTHIGLINSAFYLSQNNN